MTNQPGLKQAKIFDLPNAPTVATKTPSLFDLPTAPAAPSINPQPHRSPYSTPLFDLPYIAAKGKDWRELTPADWHACHNDAEITYWTHIATHDSYCRTQAEMRLASIANSVTTAQTQVAAAIDALAEIEAQYTHAITTYADTYDDNYNPPSLAAKLGHHHHINALNAEKLHHRALQSVSEHRIARLNALKQAINAYLVRLETGA